MSNDKNQTNDEKKLLVSICCLAYNHEKYIRECLDGFLMQKCDFDFEVLIHDDASTDNTPDIIKEYEIRYPNIIKPIYQIENQYSKGVKISFKFNFPRAGGKYIAMCEGDDYWTDPFKLQKQVDFLKGNQEYSTCFTNAMVIDQNATKIRSYIKFNDKKTYPIEDLIMEGGGLFPTATLTFRNSIKDWPDFTSDYKSGDRVLALFLGEIGPFYYLAETTAVYRSHGGGVFSSIKNNKEERIRINRDNIRLLDAFNKYSGLKYNKIIKEAVSIIALRSLLRNRYGLLRYNRLFFYKQLKLRDWIKFANKVIRIRTKRIK
ncbi:MAG: glycosyltransferase [Bacteroidota bacterium]